jgi:hypothetical protein
LLPLILYKETYQQEGYLEYHWKPTERVSMNNFSAPGILLLTLILAPFSTLLSAEEAKGAAAVQSSSGFAYRPPVRGAPASRVGGGSRGVGDITLELSVLAPDHTGLTTKSQPTLYWFISKPANARLDVTVINDEDIDPILEKVVGTPKSAGIQKLDLATAGTTLKPGIEYRWFVSVTPDEGQRSNDVVASGTIQYTAPDADLKSRIAKSDERTLASIYAENGVWYDAIDSISRAIQHNPGDANLRARRAALLEQVGLTAVADYDRR